MCTMSLKVFFSPLIIDGFCLQVNHGVRPEELREVGTIWESLDFGFAADDTALKLCIEKRPDFRRCVACCTTLHFLENILTILRISGQTLFFYVFGLQSS